MKLRASEFISKAEGLKSSELSVRRQLESIRAQRAGIRRQIETLEYRLDALYMQLEALENAESDDEDGNGAQIADIMAEISSTQEEISEEQRADAELRSEEAEANAELRSIEMEERSTLSEIQDSASRTNQNIALISSFGGDYANVSAQASNSFQKNFGKLSQAAQILGGSVAMGAIGSGSAARNHKSGRAAALTQGGGSERNFYEAANNQRKSGNAVSGGMGAKVNSGRLTGKKGLALSSDSSLREEQPSKKIGGFGKKSGIHQSIANAFNLPGAAKEFSGCTAIKRSDHQDGWDIPGTGFGAYDDFRNNRDNYERVTYESAQMGIASADNIEGISNIRTADIEHPEIFWGRDSGKTMDDFVEIARHIPEVDRELKNGKSLDDLMLDERLGQCASIYFAGAPTVYKGNGFYEFSGNGRHRVLAARALGLTIPVLIVGEIQSRKQGGLGKRDAFIKSIKYNPTPVGSSNATKVGTTASADRSGRNLDGSAGVSEAGEKTKKAGGLGRKPSVDLRKSPLDALTNYMVLHNYSQADFSEYSMDPEWRVLQKAAFPDYQMPPMEAKTAFALLSQYMSLHNYGPDDYATYSKDPIWKELHDCAYPKDTHLATRNKNNASANGTIRYNEFGVQSIESVQNWIKSINPNPYNDPRRQVNCGKCAAAVFMKLNGNSTATAGLGTYSIPEMNKLTGKTQTTMTPEQIKNYLISQGPGSHAVIGVDRASGAGHWFNAYYDGHQVYTIEGQGGEIRGWPPDYGNVVHWDVSI